MEIRLPVFFVFSAFQELMQEGEGEEAEEEEEKGKFK